MRYRLIAEDQHWALAAGIERLQRNIDAGTWRPMIDDGGDPITIEQHACGAEIAFARMVGVQPVLIKDKWARQPNGHLPNGQPYNVQHTPRPDGNLLVAYNSHPPQEWIFVLCHSVWPVFEFRGWIPGELLLRYRNLKNPQPGNPRAWCFFWSRIALRDALEYW